MIRPLYDRPEIQIKSRTSKFRVNTSIASSTSLKENSPAPQFSSIDQDGKPFKLSSLKGKKVALYCYPKDMTPGCTTQACNIRDNFKLLPDKGIIVIGISPDSSASHVKFREKKELPFMLLSDPEHSVFELYGVWGEKSMYGKKFLGVIRTTFLIDEKGTLVKIITKPKDREDPVISICIIQAPIIEIRCVEKFELIMLIYLQGSLLRACCNTYV